MNADIRQLKNGFGGFTGQTLIELMVTLSVVVGLMSLLIVYNRTGQRVARVPRAAEKLVFDLRRAQDYALTVREFTGGEPPCGYGVHFDTGSAADPLYGMPRNRRYIIFADVPDGSGCASANGQRNANGFEDVEVIQMEEGVIVTSSDASDITFVPPSAVVIFNPPVSPAVITLGLEGGVPAITKSVRVNRVGRITPI